MIKVSFIKHLEFRILYVVVFQITDFTRKECLIAVGTIHFY